VIDAASYGSHGGVVYGETADSATLEVSVPEDATVYVNDTRTKTTGSERRYVSRDLKPGQNYTYTVRAEFTRDGKLVTATKSATLRAGGSAQLAFTTTSAVDSPPVTTLKVHVPDDAKVILAGAETKQTGSDRIYSTTQLSAGETWENYTIRVEAERDGRVVAQERTISLTAGDVEELTFEFDSTADSKLAGL
jgi:uncharacterized protein (TIGR03000 family)